MTIPANLQKAAAPWGADPVYLCYGPEGGPFTVVTASAGLPVVPNCGVSGGATPYSLIAAAGANQDSTTVKASAGQVYEIVCSNINASPCYLKLYDKASGPTSSDTPVWRLLIPGNTAGAGLAKTIPDGLVFSTGISFRITTGAADNNASAVTANEVLVNIGYK